MLAKKILFSLFLFFGFFSIANAQTECSPAMSDQPAISIAQNAMNTWFTAIQKNDLQTVNELFSPQFVILPSKGAPMTNSEELNLLTGFHLGGYQFSDFCAMRITDTIVATFASKTYGKDISKTKVKFLSKSKAYRMIVMKKMQDHWLIIAYANTNPIS